MLVEWNLFKGTTKLCDLSRQEAFQNRENKHGFVKTMQVKKLNVPSSL